jgi:flagellar hook protein FlgE
VTNNPLDIAINGGGFFQHGRRTGGTLTAATASSSSTRTAIIVNSPRGCSSRASWRQWRRHRPASPTFRCACSIPARADRCPRRPATSTGGAVRPTSTSIRACPAIALPFNYTDPTTYNQSTAVTTYDSLGNPHTYSMYFVKTAANAWDVYATVTNPAGAASATFQLGRGGQPDVQHVGQHLGADCRRHFR